MTKETVSFRVEAKKRAALDELAAVLERDRSSMINEALDAYLELHHWQVEHIERALAEADSGVEGVAHAQVFDKVRARIDRRLKSSD